MSAQQFPKQPHNVKILWYGSRSRLPTEVTITPAPCACAPSSSNAESTSPLAASRWLTGSSSRMKSKGWHKQRMNATRCCCPNESFPAGVSRLPAIPQLRAGARSGPRQKVGKFVLQREILRHGQFPEQPQVLKEQAQRPAAQFAPLRHGKRPAVRSVEQDAARIVGSGPVQKTAQRRLSGSRSGFDQIILPLAECHVMQPQVRFRRLRIARKGVRQHLLQSNRLHTSSVSGKRPFFEDGRFSVSTDITNSLPARTDESARRSCRKWS